MTAPTSGEVKSSIDLLVTEMNEYKAAANPDDIPYSDLVKYLKKSFKTLGFDILTESDGSIRWIKNTFFLGGPTKNPTLSARFNAAASDNTTFADSTDAQIASEIMTRADLGDRVFHDDILDILTKHLGNVDDPILYANPLAPPNATPEVNREEKIAEEVQSSPEPDEPSDEAPSNPDDSAPTPNDPSSNDETPAE